MVPPSVPIGLDLHAIYFGPAGHYDIPKFKEAGLTAQVWTICLDDKLPDELRYGLEMTR